MKIFHALVGYLAATALPPFHPSAFAAPGIHYGGYVDTTQNPSHNIDGALTGTGTKGVLGNIETSQKVTSHTGSLSGYVNATRNHSDSANIIEARQPPLAIAIPLLGLVITTVILVIASVSWISDDDPVRGNDVEFIIEHSIDSLSARNVRRLPKILSPNSLRSTRSGTGLFAIPPIASILMEMRARTGVTPITSYLFHFGEQLGRY